MSILKSALAPHSQMYPFDTKPSIVDRYLALCCRWMQLYPQYSAPHLHLASFPQLRSMLKALQLEPFVAKTCAAQGIGGPEFVEPAYANPSQGTAT